MRKPSLSSLSRRVCLLTATFAISVAPGCDSNPNGPAAPASIPSPEGPAATIKAGQTPTALANGQAAHEGRHHRRPQVGDQDRSGSF